MPTAIALEHSDGHRVCRGLAKRTLIFGRKEESRVVRFPFFLGSGTVEPLPGMERSADKNGFDGTA